MSNSCAAVHVFFNVNQDGGQLQTTYIIIIILLHYNFKKPFLKLRASSPVAPPPPCRRAYQFGHGYERCITYVLTQSLQKSVLLSLGHSTQCQRKPMIGFIPHKSHYKNEITSDPGYCSYKVGISVFSRYLLRNVHTIYPTCSTLSLLS